MNEKTKTYELNIYNVEMKSRFVEYIGVNESWSEVHSAIRVVGDIINEGYEPNVYELDPGDITKHSTIKEALIYCKKKYPHHKIIDLSNLLTLAEL